MKRILLLSVMLCCMQLSSSRAQSPTPVPVPPVPIPAPIPEPSMPPGPPAERVEKNGFTILLVPAPRNTFLFRIQKAGKPVFDNPMNPVTMLPDGFRYKEDAIKVAEWMTREYARQEHFPPFVPLHVIRELRLRNDPFSPPQNP